ncbi:MAG: acyl-CoA dehydrogenase family protein [Actinomycetota bacterium]
MTSVESHLLQIDGSSSLADVEIAVTQWVEEQVPRAWIEASREGISALRAVRPRSEYESWYPVFASSGLAVSTWPRRYLGLELKREQARLVEALLAPLNLGRLNPLGLNSAAPALFAHGTEEQRLRYLPPIVRNEEKWCQLLSEPGAGSDLASLACRAVRDGDEWIIDGQKVWTTWAHFSDYAVCLARTDPEAKKRNGLTYFMIDLRAVGVEVRPLRHIGGAVDFNEVFLSDVRVPDSMRLGAIHDGWRVAGSTLSGERQMVSGAGSGGVDRIGGASASQLLDRLRQSHSVTSEVDRDDLMQVYSEERLREWTNMRVRSAIAQGWTAGAAASIGKVHQGSLNQRIQMVAHEMLGPDSQAWTHGDEYSENMPLETKGMLRSRANTIEGGTTEVNKNILGERVLGLPREPDPWSELPWKDTPRS